MQERQITVLVNQHCMLPSHSSMQERQITVLVNQHCMLPSHSSMQERQITVLVKKTLHASEPFYNAAS